MSMSPSMRATSPMTMPACMASAVVRPSSDLGALSSTAASWAAPRASAWGAELHARGDDAAAEGAVSSKSSKVVEVPRSMTRAGAP